MIKEIIQENFSGLKMQFYAKGLTESADQWISKFTPKSRHKPLWNQNPGIKRNLGILKVYRRKKFFKIKRKRKKWREKGRKRKEKTCPVRRIASIKIIYL